MWLASSFSIYLIRAHSTSLKHSSRIPINMMFNSPMNDTTCFAKRFPISVAIEPMKSMIPVFKGTIKKVAAKANN